MKGAFRVPHRVSVLVLRWGTLALLVGLWVWAQGPGGVSPLILPSVQDTFSESLNFLTTREVYSALGVTVTELSVSLLLAVLAGFGISFWAARTSFRARVVEPLLVWGYLVPHILFYPLIVLWFGVGMSSKIAYASTSAVLPIAFNCLRAFRRVDIKYLDVGRAYGASPRQLDWLIKLRASVPLAAAGLRIGAGLAMITVIVAEMLSSTNGLGYLLKYYSQSFNTAKVYSIILVVLMIVGIYQFLIGKVLPRKEDR